MKGGLIHVYIGDGKGKTTAAVGLSVRAAGRDMKVLFAQFLKTSETGELRCLEQIGVGVLRSDLVLGFTHQMSETAREACRGEQRKLLDRIGEILQTEKIDLLVMDEVIDGVNSGMLDEGALRSFVEGKGEDLELVMTGRRPPEWIIAAADYVSDIKKVKHPYDRGIKARTGIER
jgi:cob(I)alamin adenosyltransferase